MAARATAPTTAQAVARASWLPMIIILMAQIQMAFNVNALPVSMGPIVETLDTPATMIGTALVVYSLCVAAFVMLGAKLGKICRRASRLPSYGNHSRPGHGTDGGQPRRPRDDWRPGAGRPGGSRPCADPRGASRGQLSQRSAGTGIGAPGRSAGDGRRPGVSHRRLSRHSLQLALFVWHHARPLACGARIELPPKAGPAPEGCQDRFRRRAADRLGNDFDQPGL